LCIKLFQKKTVKALFVWSEKYWMNLGALKLTSYIERKKVIKVIKECLYNYLMVTRCQGPPSTSLFSWQKSNENKNRTVGVKNSTKKEYLKRYQWTLACHFIIWKGENLQARCPLSCENRTVEVNNSATKKKTWPGTSQYRSILKTSPKIPQKYQKTTSLKLIINPIHSLLRRRSHSNPWCTSIERNCPNPGGPPQGARTPEIGKEKSGSPITSLLNKVEMGLSRHVHLVTSINAY